MAFWLLPKHRQTHRTDSGDQDERKQRQVKRSAFQWKHASQTMNGSSDRNLYEAIQPFQWIDRTQTFNIKILYPSPPAPFPKLNFNHQNLLPLTCPSTETFLRDSGEVNSHTGQASQFYTPFGTCPPILRRIVLFSPLLILLSCKVVGLGL